MVQAPYQESLADVPDYVSTPELRIDVPEEIKFGLVEQAVQYFRGKHKVIDVDGVRVLFGDGWGLIRASNTQPVLVALGCGNDEGASSATSPTTPRRRRARSACCRP